MLLSQSAKVQQVNRTVGLFVLAMAFTLMGPDTLAQGGGGGVAGSLTAIAKIISTSGNVIFIILMVVGLIRTVAGFISNSPNAAKNLLMLVIGAALWYGFNTIVDDITASVGGSAGGGYDGK